MDAGLIILFYYGIAVLRWKFSLKEVPHRSDNKNFSIKNLQRYKGSRDNTTLEIVQSFLIGGIHESQNTPVHHNYLSKHNQAKLLHPPHTVEQCPPCNGTTVLPLSYIPSNNSPPSPTDHNI